VTQHDGREPAELVGEQPAQAPPVEAGEASTGGGAGHFGDVAAEMADETETGTGTDVEDGKDEIEDDRRDGEPEQEPESTPDQDELAVTLMALAERTADLQRLQAEFVNYKRRVDRDRDLTRENARYVVLTPIIDVLDNIDRAREHGPLDDGFKAVAEQLERVVSGLGISRFGEPGDAFDPTVHEALSYVGEDPDVSVPTAKFVAKAGYKIGDRVVRAAQVLVADPESD